jgi:hypothetical protein
MSRVAPEIELVKAIQRPSGDQVGDVELPVPLVIREVTPFLISMTKTSDSPSEWETKAIWDPSGFQEGVESDRPSAVMQRGEEPSDSIM